MLTGQLGSGWGKEKVCNFVKKGTPMTNQELIDLLNDLLKQGSENEWIEFKHNYQGHEKLGVYVSALANSACLHDKPFAYLIFGVADHNLAVTGTDFDPLKEKVENQGLEIWLAKQLRVKVDFRFYRFEYQGFNVVLLRIPAVKGQPEEFKGTAYIRVGSATPKLSDFPEKARQIWNSLQLPKTFEEGIALEKLTPADIVKLLDTQIFYDLQNKPYPSRRDTVVEQWINNKLVIKQNGSYAITNLGAMLFAKNLDDFDGLKYKAIRVVVYEGKNKTTTLLKDKFFREGYAVCFVNLVNYVNDQLPQHEEITSTFRIEKKMYPEDAVREIIANLLVHQDFDISSRFPSVRIFADRIEFLNPGKPILSTERFIDQDNVRNIALVELMRRLKICEREGSGIDKVISGCEEFQLPAPSFSNDESSTTIILFGSRLFNEMSKDDKIRACYQHCCLKYLNNDFMTNQSLRHRFGLGSDNSASSTTSQLINDTIKKGLIKRKDEKETRKNTGYIPHWA